MSGSYRGLIVAASGVALFVTLGTGAFIGSLYAPQKSHYQTEPAKGSQANPTTKPKNGLADTTGIDALTERIIAKPQPQNTAERQDRDLAAQEAMAVFAYWMFWGIVLQTLLAGGALFALLKDLGQNKSSSERQMRAYVRFELKKGGVVFVPGKKVSVAMDLINYGQTPAHNVQFQHASTQEALDWVWDESDAPIRTRNASVSLHQSSPVKVVIESDEDLEQGDFESVRGGQSAFYGRAIVFYKDVFGGDWLTQISLEIRASDLANRQVKISPIGNIAT